MPGIQNSGEVFLPACLEDAIKVRPELRIAGESLSPHAIDTHLFLAGPSQVPELHF